MATGSRSFYQGGSWMDFPYDPLPRRPKIKVTHAEADLVKFTLSDTDVSVANALRRIMLAEIPTMAIEIVNIDDNETALFDEFIAHRMGLLPLSSHAVGDIPPDNGLVEYKDCHCFDGCRQCTREFRVRAHNTEDKVLTVTHFDVEYNHEGAEKYKPPNEPAFTEVRPCPFRDPFSDEQNDRRDNGIIIAKMKKDQRLNMICLARKGIAKYHSKWMPVATALYNYQPIIELDREQVDSLSLDDKIALVQACPRKTLGLDVQDKVQVVRLQDCIFDEEIVEKAKQMGRPDMVKVKMDTNIFHFTVEAVCPDGPRTAIDVVRASMRILDYKMSEFLRDAEGTPITEWLPKDSAV